MTELIVDDHTYFPRLNDNINCWRPTAVQDFTRLCDAGVFSKWGDAEIVRRRDNDETYRINDLPQIERTQDCPPGERLDDNTVLERA